MHARSAKKYDHLDERNPAAKRASEMLGKRVECIITEKDPKNYSTSEIKNLLTIE